MTTSARRPPKPRASRLDAETVNRGLAESLERGRALIMAGDIRVNGQTVYKADAPVLPDDILEIKEKSPYVSRGADKIAAVFEAFGISARGLNVLDIGVSTGGFADYMLQGGARAAAGVDVNIRQVDARLRQHPGLTLIEKNARFLTPGDLPFVPDLITIDVSFISILKILPRLTVFPNAAVISLVKPQFETPARLVERGGIVRDPETRLQTALALKEKLGELNYSVVNAAPAGLAGRRGNREFFFLLRYGNHPVIDDTIIAHVIRNPEL